MRKTHFESFPMVHMGWIFFILYLIPGCLFKKIKQIDSIAFWNYYK